MTGLAPQLEERPREPEKGMSLIVRTATALVAALVVTFGIVDMAYGHMAPGGGFSGGVILACGLILLCLAFGRELVEEIVSRRMAVILGCIGPLAFLAVASALGYGGGGGFFSNVLWGGEAMFVLTDGGTILPCNLAIGVEVGACLFGVFLALAVFRPGSEAKD